jgi:hypothetical protein
LFDKLKKIHVIAKEKQSQSIAITIPELKAVTSNLIKHIPTGSKNSRYQRKKGIDKPTTQVTFSIGLQIQGTGAQKTMFLFLIWQKKYPFGPSHPRITKNTGTTDFTLLRLDTIEWPISFSKF